MNSSYHLFKIIIQLLFILDVALFLIMKFVRVRTIFCTVYFYSRCFNGLMAA